MHRITPPREQHRYQLADRATIIERMAADVSDLADQYGQDRDVTERDLIRLGWEPHQIRAYTADVIARVHRDRHEAIDEAAA